MKHGDPERRHEATTLQRRRSTDSVDDVIPVQSLEGRHEDAEKKGDDEGIKYEYLTFQTELAPSMLTALNASGVQPPNLLKTESPFDWSPGRKNVILFLSCAATLCAAYSAGSYSIAAEPLREKWHVSGVAFNVSSIGKTSQKFCEVRRVLSLRRRGPCLASKSLPSLSLSSCFTWSGLLTASPNRLALPRGA